MILHNHRNFRHLTKAMSYLGTMEVPGQESSPIINQFLKVVGLPSDDEIPWCAAYAYYILVTENIVTLADCKPNARSFLDVGFHTDDPYYGDIVVLKRGTQEWQGHVGFYLGRIQIGPFKRIILLGGNQSNQVKISLYPEEDVLGYRKLFV